MLTLIKNVDIYAPEPLGCGDILLADGRIAFVQPDLALPADLCRIIDGTGMKVVPGFIDNHVHILGGGGEGGFATRTPELMLSDAVKGGVTTIVGCLGTDGYTRSMYSLLAKARGLEEEGISTWCLTGSYGVPVRTLMNSVEEDLICIDKIIGAGEIAISDHRSSQPTFDELVRIAGEARRGGMLGGKAGLVNLHLGDGPRMLELLERMLEETEIPVRHFLPTHMNRNPQLFAKGIEFARHGGFVDFTTSTVPAFLADGEVESCQALRLMLEAGVDIAQITFSSDGQGGLPEFDARGRLQGLTVGRVTSLFQAVRDAVLRENIPLETALRVITCNPATLLQLKRKGRLAPGMDADLVLLDDDLNIQTVIAKGRVLMESGNIIVSGTFE